MAQKHESTVIEIIARGLLVGGSRILLCRNKRGIWFLPGGHVEFGEPAATALAREFVEETGMVMKVGPCVLIQEHIFDQGGEHHHELNLVFHVEPSTKNPQPKEGDVISLESGLAFEWVDLAALSDLDLRPIAIKAWLMSAAPPQTPVQWLSAD